MPCGITECPDIWCEEPRGHTLAREHCTATRRVDHTIIRTATEPPREFRLVEFHPSGLSPLCPLSLLNWPGGDINCSAPNFVGYGHINDQMANKLDEVLHEARRRAPLYSLESRPWPDPPEAIPPESLCTCGHTHEQHDNGGRCRKVVGLGFGFASHCLCAVFVLKVEDPNDSR